MSENETEAISVNMPTARWAGEFYMGGEIILWSIFPIVTRFTVGAISPLAVSAWTSLFAGILFLILLLWKPVKIPPRSSPAWKNMIISTLIIGIAYYFLVFSAAKLTSPGNVSLLLNLEVLFAILFLTRSKGEELTLKQKVGALLMCIGAMVVVKPADFKISIGDVMLIVATAIAPIGNIFQKRARRETSSSFILLFRSFVSAAALAIAAFFVEGSLPMPEANSAWFLIAVNGVLFLGLSKIFWIEAIHRMPISKAASYASITPFLCLAWLAVFFSEHPEWAQIIGGVPLAVGMILLNLRENRISPEVSS